MSTILIVVSFMSCGTSHVYHPEIEWEFSLNRSDRLDTDTVYLKTFDETILNGQIKCEWILCRQDSNNMQSISVSETGIIDNSGNFFRNLFLKPEVWIHPLRSSTDYYYLTEMLPFPWIQYPISIGQIIEWELTPEAGWGDLKGRSVVGEIKVVDKIFYSNPVVNDSCWVIETIGISSIGNFSSKYYFNEKLGFVYFHYDLNDYTIDIEVIDYNKSADNISIMPDLYFISKDTPRSQ